MATLALSYEPTLRKLGSHLRWFLEKNNIDAESVIVSINVPSERERSLLITGFLQAFDQSCMRREDQTPQWLEVHGVKIVAVVRPPKEKAKV